MNKNVLFYIIFLFVCAIFVSARSLIASQESVIKISTKVCSFGEKKCYLNAYQNCDGSSFVTKQLCLNNEYCTLDRGCIKKSFLSNNVDFSSFRLTQCKSGEFVCRGRFVKVCRNNVWMEEFCKMDEVCIPYKMCVKRNSLTRFIQRNLYIPSTHIAPYFKFG